jgi:hypothetical protein
MRPIGLIGAAVLFLFLGAVAPTYAQDQPAKPEEQQAKDRKKQEKDQPAKPEEQQAKDRKKQEKEKPAKSEEQAKDQNKQGKEQQAKPEEQQAKGQQKQEKELQAGSSQGPQRTQQAEAKQRAEPALRLSLGGGGRIPDDRFRSNFGPEHSFRIGSPRMIGGYSRFEYGGFSFGFVDPWPENWYYVDDVYVDFMDGEYYLYNPYYPGVRIAICVVV